MDKFIKKLETDNYKIGSFDAFIDKSSGLIANKYKMNEEEVSEYLKLMPTTYRASVLDKEDNFVGFVGIKNVDFKNEIADIVCEFNDDISLSDKEEILNEYKKYLFESINIRKYNKKNKKSKERVLKTKYITPGIDEETLAIYTQMYPDMPKLTLPVTLSMNGIVFGVIGLSNLIRSNRRADLKIYLNKDLGNFDAEFLSVLIDEYLSFVHKDNIWSINFEIGADQRNIIDAVDESRLSFYGTIPFADVHDDTIGNLLMFQHTPHIIANNPSSKSEIYVDKSIFDAKRDEMSDIILLGDGYSMVRPSIMDKASNPTLFEDSLQKLSNAMSDRNRFSIPLGDDKFFPQVGNEKYGLYKALNNYSYIILDQNNMFAGFINILRQDSQKKHCEIEIAIIPEKQNQGIGKKATEEFYKELFELGYVSVTTKVFDFNKKSKALSDKISQFNGRRLESYYTNGRLWDMNIYTKLNPRVEKVKIR